MNKLKEAAELVLAAMGSVGANLICENSHHRKKDQHKDGVQCPIEQRWHEAYEALHQALAQGKQEPVAWTLTEFLDKRETTTNAPLWFVDPVNSAWTPLYAAPPSKPEQEPVAWLDEELGLAYTAEELADVDGTCFIPLYTAPPSKRDVNQELVEALREIANETYDEWTNGARAQRIAEAALTKHKEQA